MATFSFGEFREFFLSLSKEFSIDKSTEFLSSIEDNIQFYESLGIRERKFSIPQKYVEKVTEYFILINFYRFYLSGLGQSLTICKTFNLIDSIKEVTMLQSNGAPGSIPINEESLEILSEEYQKMQSLFIELGKGLLGVDFTINDL